MATRYWVGGSGTWDATSTTNWSASSGGSSGASAPTSVDDVIFDAASNVGTGAFTVTVGGTTTAPSVCNDFSTGGAGGALDGAMTLAFGTTGCLDVYGNLTLPATNLSVTGATSTELRFQATTTGKTITTNGVSIAGVVNVGFNGVGGGWTLGSALTANGLFPRAGTFDTGNYTLTINSIQRTSTLGTTVVNLGSSSITCSGTTPINFTNTTNLTFNAGTSTITCSATSPTFTGGGQTFYNVTFSSTGTGTTALTGINTFNNLTFATITTAGIRAVTFGNSCTVNGTLTLNTATVGVRRMTVTSNTIGGVRTITAATLAAASDVDFRDIIASGTSAPWSGTRFGDGGGNTSITFAAPKTVYWSLATGGNWSSTAWATSSGGTPVATDFPLAQDSVIIEDTGLNTGATITINANWWIGSLDCSTRTNAFNWTQGNSDPQFYGATITLSSSMTMTTATGSPTFNFLGRGVTQTFTSAGVQLRLNQFNVNNLTGSVVLVGNTLVDLDSTATGNIVLTSGTLNLNNNTLTCYVFSSSGSVARTLAFGTGKIVLLGSNATIFTTSVSTNLTVTGTPLVQCTYSGSVGGRGINMGAAGEANAISFDITAGSDIISLATTNGAFKNVNFTGFTGTISLANSPSIFGNWDVGGATSFAGVGSLAFVATSGTQTVNFNGISFPNTITFGSSATTATTFSLSGAVVVAGASGLVFGGGTLTTNNNAITTTIFNSNSSVTRTLNLGSSTVTLTGTGTVWDITTSTGMTLNAGTSSITTSSSAGTITFAGGGLTYYNVTFGATYYNTTLSGANTLNNLTISSPAGVGRRSVNFSNNQTINGTLTAVGSAANSRSRLIGATGGTTITAAAVSLSDADFNNIIAAGVSSPWSGTRLGDMGGNTNIIFATPKTVYWNQPAGGNWSDVAWALTSGGSVGANNFPLAQDTAILDNTGVGASTTITIDYGYNLPALNASSLTNAVTLYWNTFNTFVATFYGSITLSSAVTISSAANNGSGITAIVNSSITSAGVVFNTASQFSFNSVAGTTVTLIDNFNSTATSTYLIGGNVDLNGKTLTCVAFTSSYTTARSIAFNGGQIDVTGNNAVVWDCIDLTNFSYTGTPTVNFTYSGSTGTRTIGNGSTTGGTEANSVSMNITAGSDIVILNVTNGTVLNLNYTGFSGIGNLPAYIYGNLTLSATQTISAGTSGPTFAATSGVKTITTNGVTIDRPIIFNGIGGTWELQDALTLGATRSIQLFAGTLTTNGYSVTCGKFGNAGSSATGNRTLNLGSSSITVVGTSTTSASWQVENGSYVFTVNAGTSTIYMAEPYTGTSSQSFTGGSKTYYNLVYTQGQPSTITGNNTFNNISNTFQPITISFEAGSTQRFTNFNLSGTSGNLVTLNSSVPGSQATLIKPTNWNVGVNSVNGGNNTNIFFTSGGGINFLSVSDIYGVTDFISVIAETVAATDTVGVSFLWEPIVDTQTANWAQVSTVQAANWTQISTQ